MPHRPRRPHISRRPYEQYGLTQEDLDAVATRSEYTSSFVIDRFLYLLDFLHPQQFCYWKYDWVVGVQRDGFSAMNVREFHEESFKNSLYMAIALAPLNAAHFMTLVRIKVPGYQRFEHFYIDTLYGQEHELQRRSHEERKRNAYRFISSTHFFDESRGDTFEELPTVWQVEVECGPRTCLNFAIMLNTEIPLDDRKSIIRFMGGMSGEELSNISRKFVLDSFRNNEIVIPPEVLALR